MSFLHCRTECRCRRLPGIISRKCCFVRMLRHSGQVLWASAGAPGAGTCCSWGSVSSFRDKLVTKWCRWSKVQRLSGCFPAAPGQSLVCLVWSHRDIGCISPTDQALCVPLGSLQSLWHSALIQSGRSCSTPVVCEHWQNLIAGRGGDLESSRSLFFRSIAMQSCKWWFHQRFAHNLVYGSQIGFYRA